jgi:hypothetical protein
MVRAFPAKRKDETFLGDDFSVLPGHPKAPAVGGGAQASAPRAAHTHVGREFAGWIVFRSEPFDQRGGLHPGGPQPFTRAFKVAHDTKRAPDNFSVVCHVSAPDWSAQDTHRVDRDFRPKIVGSARSSRPLPVRQQVRIERAWTGHAVLCAQVRPLQGPSGAWQRPALSYRKVWTVRSKLPRHPQAAPGWLFASDRQAQQIWRSVVHSYSQLTGL